MEKLWSDRKRTLFGLPLSFTKYTLDNERLYIQEGLFHTREDEVRLYRITDLSLSRTLLQKIFKVGTIVVHSSDKTRKNFEIKSVKKSQDVKEMLSKNVEEQRDKKKVFSREFMGDSDFEADQM